MSSLTTSPFISNNFSFHELNESMTDSPISPKSSPITLIPSYTDDGKFCSNETLRPRFSFLFNQKTALSPVSSEHTDYDHNYTEEFLPILSQSWRPCTGNTTIGHYLDHTHFPVSYRDLVYRWTALQRPILHNLRMPLNLKPKWSNVASSSTSPVVQTPLLDLQDICETQERNIIQSIEENFEKGFTSQNRLFIGFASHLDIYCAVHAELRCLEDGINDARSQYAIYEEAWRNLLSAFDLDRTVCVARPQHHDCLGHLMYGEVFFWPMAEIQRRFEVYKNRSSSVQEPIGQNDILHPTAHSALSGVSLDSPHSGFTSNWPRDVSSNANTSSNTSLHSSDSSLLNTFGEISPLIPGTPWIQSDGLQSPFLESSLIKKGHSSLPAQHDENWSNTLSLLQSFQLTQGQQVSQEADMNQHGWPSSQQALESVGEQSLSCDLSGVNSLGISGNIQILTTSPESSQENNAGQKLSQSVSAPALSPVSSSSVNRDLDSLLQSTRHKRIRESETISETIITQLAKRMDRRMSIEKVDTRSNDDCLRDIFNSTSAVLGNQDQKDVKSEKYGTMLKDIASQLETAVRLMSVFKQDQQDETSTSSSTESQDKNDDRSIKRFSFSGFRRPSRPRSHTTEGEIHSNLQKIYKMIEGKTVSEDH